ncbi:uncharacterized protein LOC113557716 [Rhopalosiphum maidis]|uniref:uncharacterized protein LOC113557716 n=1 Tax=Rhopalosiphum maidis TaxID=43146 RepID=UPI000EFE2ACB|nr:uncharacterized protein LOC113557716 [Rhopalosiphum maidis]
MNGVIEYDQKLTSLPRVLLIHQFSPKENYWNIIFIFTSIYYIIITAMFLNSIPPKTVNITTIAIYFIRLEFFVEVSVMFSSYFFLQQLEYRFEMLNHSWKYLLPGFLSTPGELTHSITEMTLDKLRLLHAELLNLLRIFSEGYGQILLGYFLFTYIDILLHLYYLIIVSVKIEIYNFDIIIINCIIFFSQLKNIILILSIIIAASRVHDKKRKMISNLRLIRISKLSANLKIQVKLFMNQITVLESSEITAFGIFNINLKLVISILILIITGLVTIIELKGHPLMLQLKNDISKFLQKIRLGLSALNR